MGFIEKYFGKPPEEISAKDVEDFVSKKIEERIDLEYKDIRSFADFPQLRKEVSAFANSRGGLLILGVGESKSEPALPSGVTWGDPGLKKETLEQAIMDGIVPRMEAPRILPVRNNDLRQVFLIDVPRSRSPPHMVSGGDFRYYKRYNFEAVPMRHNEVMGYEALKAQFEETRDLAKIVFVGVVFFFAYSLARLLTYLYGSGPGLIDGTSLLAGLAVLGVIGFYSVFWQSTFERMIVGWRALSPMLVVLSYLGLLGGLVILGVGDMRYPKYFVESFSAFWSGFVLTAAEFAAVITATYFAQEQAMPHYFRRMKEYDPLDVLKLDLGSATFDGFKSLRSLLRSRKAGAFVAIALLCTGFAQPLDSQFSITSPSISSRTTPVMVNYFLPNPPAKFVIGTNWNNAVYNDSTSTCKLDAYALYNQTIDITTPASSVHSIEDFVLSDPSNVSKSLTQALVLPGQVQYQIWNDFFISNPNRTSLSFEPSQYNVSSVTVSVSGLPSHSDALLNVYYYLKAHPSASCTESLESIRLVNGSEMVIARYVIQNNENATMALGCLNFFGALYAISGDPLTADPSGVTLYRGSSTTPFSVQGYDGVCPYYEAIPPMETVAFTLVAIGNGVY